MLSRLPTRCKHCKVKFTPEESGLRLHADCIESWAAEFRAKKEKKRVAKAKAAKAAERREIRAKKEAMKSIAKLIAEAQTAFNAFIRERDKNETCFVCDRPFDPNVPGRRMHAGHVRSRGAAGHLRFNEDNCHGECEGCNGPHGAKPHEIEAGAIRRIGQERYDVLKNDNTPCKWQRDELIAIKNLYKAKLKALKENTTW